MNSSKKCIKDSGLWRMRASRCLLLSAIMLVFFVTNTGADGEDYRSKGQENWVRFTFVLKDSETGQPVRGRVYYQSEFAADWFPPDNTRPLLPPGVYRVVGWERHYWQSEQKLIANPRKGLQQQVVIKLNPVTTRRDERSSSAMKVPPILSTLVITGNTINKAPHMNSSWFGQSSMATISLFMNALSEYSGGSGGGSRSSSVNIYYYFFLKLEDAQKHFERLRPGFKTIPTSSQHVSGPTPVSLGDEALQIRIDTERGDRKGILYETRKYLIRDGNFVVMMHIHKEVGLDFLTSPEEILNRVRSLDVQQVKLMLEPEPYPWPEITPTPGAGKDVDSLPDEGETTSSENVAGGSVPEFTPAELAAASSLAGGAALVGALLLMGMSGVGREDIIQALRDLLRGSVPADSFDAWKQKYEALGWKYNVKNGVATFDPVDGCRDEEGLIWSSQKGAFVNSDEPVAPPLSSRQPHEGDVNENGEIYSLNYGWSNTDEYKRNLAISQHIKDVNAVINRQSDAVAQDLGSAWVDSRQKLEDMRETGKYVDLSTRLADNFGTTEEKTWCLDFINRHAKAGPDGYAIDPETARQMYSGLKKQMYTSGQILNLAETQYQTSVAKEVEEKTKVVTQIRDNAARVNRVLAKFDPTGTGGKIVDFQQSVYGAIEGYEKGGIAGAAESAMLTVADNYTQGYASGNYNALKDAYAEQGISDESLAARLAKANFDTANNKYNVLDHVGKAANNILEGEYGAAVDSTLDAFDAKDSLKDDYGKAKDWATRPKTDTPDKISVSRADTIPDTTPAGDKSLGTMRRESFEKTRVSFENQTKMMQELNRVADIPDPTQRQAELIRVRNSDPSAYNVVKKELHPATAKVITDTNKTLSDQVVERQAKILSEKGFTPEVRLTGKAGGADTDGQWTLKDSDGNVLPESETRKQAEEALKQASDDILEPLGTNADEMGHKIMNDSREKFDADPNALGIESRDGKLVDGKLVTEGHAKTGDHWKDTAAERATTAPADRIASEAMTKKNAASLGEVMKTKTEHLDEIARNKGDVTESNMRDMAREITKTDQRTFLAMAQKAGVKPTGEYRDLMQKLKLVSDGDISSDHLPPVREIDRIIAENVGMLKDAIKD